jgi:hypothetical protein
MDGMDGMDSTAAAVSHLWMMASEGRKPFIINILHIWSRLVWRKETALTRFDPV